MRMRRKRNLDERIENSKLALIDVDTTELNAKIAKEQVNYIDLQAVFNNNNPVFLEIGCGKGSFSLEMAKSHPNINIIGVEMLSNYIVDGCDKALKENIPNVKFICTKAEYLPKYFKNNSIDRIYLNFSTPYPKKTYANSRLTSVNFLNIYRDILIDNGEIHQKTDNLPLFNYSLEQYSKNGFVEMYRNLDLHNNLDIDNIMTEYETKFVKLNLPIFKVIVKKV